MQRKQLPVLLFSLALLFCFACNQANDDTILTHIKAQLYSEPLLKSASVNVTAKDGVVTLTGQVPDNAARLAAQHIASATPGVKTVIDQTTTQAPVAVAVAAPAAPPKREHAPKPPRAPKQSDASKQIAQTPPVPVTPASDSVPNPGPLHDASNDKVADTRPSMPAAPPPPPPPQPVTVTIPDGTIVTVRTIDAIDSSVNQTGQSFRGSLDAPIVIDDKVVVPKGLNVNLKLVEASSAGKFKGRSELTVSLDSFTYQGRTYRLSSSDVQEKGGSRGKRSAAVIGGGAALGALIGGLAGGGKGAAIGAGVGAGGGTAVQALTKGEQVKIPSETRLDFTLRDPVDVTYLPRKATTRPPQPVPPAPSSTDAPADSSSNPPPATTDRPPNQ